MKAPEFLLETMTGFLEKIDGEVAYARLEFSDGFSVDVEFSAKEMEDAGIRVGRRFTCEIERYALASVPDKELTEERRLEINEWLENIIGKDDDI